MTAQQPRPVLFLDQLTDLTTMASSSVNLLTGQTAMASSSVNLPTHATTMASSSIDHNVSKKKKKPNHLLMNCFDVNVIFRELGKNTLHKRRFSSQFVITNSCTQHKFTNQLAATVCQKPIIIFKPSVSWTHGGKAQGCVIVRPRLFCCFVCTVSLR